MQTYIIIRKYTGALVLAHDNYNAVIHEANAKAAKRIRAVIEQCKSSQYELISKS